MKVLPREAIISVTLNCNSRCRMCDIWQKQSSNEVKPEFYRQLPSSLKEINLTGGEPFLRDDLPAIVGTIKETCPKARIVISTNGFLVTRIKKVMPKIVQLDSGIGIRVSLDGEAKIHDRIRGVKGGYQKAVNSLNYLKGLVKDLGIGFTLMEENKKELLKVWQFCQKNNLEFSLASVFDSPIFFGQEKINLQPKKNHYLEKVFQKLIKQQYQSNKPKDWLRAWFNQGLNNFFLTGKRQLDCNAGQGFFYLDSQGKIYVCHLKPWLLGDLTKDSFEKIYNSLKAKQLRKKANKCHDCWLICTTRAKMRERFISIGISALVDKLKRL